MTKQCCGNCERASDSSITEFMWCEIVGHVHKTWGTTCKAYKGSGN